MFFKLHFLKNNTNLWNWIAKQHARKKYKDYAINLFIFILWYYIPVTNRQSSDRAPIEANNIRLKYCFFCYFVFFKPIVIYFIFYA